MAEAKQVKLAELKPDMKNANTGTERGSYALTRSLQDLGAGRSILLDRDGRIIAGNKTWEKAGELGFDDVIIVETDGRQLVAVKRTDLDLEDDPENRARLMAYADNRVAELDLHFDPEVLKGDVADGVDLTGFWTETELANYMGGFGRGFGGSGDKEDGPDFFDATGISGSVGETSQKMTYLLYVSFNNEEDFTRALSILTCGDRRSTREGTSFASIDGQDYVDRWRSCNDDEDEEE